MTFIAENASMPVSDPYFGIPIYRDRWLAEQRVAFMVSRPNSFAIITGITDGGGLSKPRPWLRYWSRYTLGEKERQRDRKFKVAK